LLVGLAAVAVTGCPVILGPDTAGTVSFTGTPSKGTAPLTVYFHGKAQVVPPYEVQDWSWTFGDGQTGSGQHIIHTYTQPGLYTVSLTVSLAGPKFRGEEDPPPTELVQTGTIEVLRANTPPVANAGPDQSVFLGPAVALDGSASYDPDGDVITYAWTFLSRPAGSTAALTGATTVNPSFWPDKKGPYQLQLIVNDGALDSAPDTVVITVLNRPPIADAGPDQAGVRGLVTILNGSGSSDPDGDPLTYAWTFVSRPVGSTAALNNATAFNPTFVPDLEGPYQIQLIVNDGTVDSAPDTVVITVPNLPPLANAGPDQSIVPGVVVNLDGSASSDPDSDPLTYAWTFLVRPSGSAAVLDDPTAEMPSFTADRPGAYELQLIVNDGTVDSGPDTVVITTRNRPPVADAGPDQEVDNDEFVTLDGSGSSDPDGDSLTYAWTMSSQPVGSTAMLADADKVNPTFTTDLIGSYEIQLIVNDGLVDSAPDTVVVATYNQPPTAVAIALPQNDVSADVGADPVLTPDGEVLYGVPRRGEYPQGKQYEMPIDLLRIDPATAAILSRIPITMIMDTGLGYLPLAYTLEARGLAVDPTNGEMWAILGCTVGLADYFVLVRLDPHTGVAVPCVDPTVNPLSDLFLGLALDDQGLAYGVTGNSYDYYKKVVDTNRALYELDKGDASDTFVIQFSEIVTGGTTPGEAIAFNTDDGLMYHASGTEQLLDDRIFETLDLDTVVLSDVPLATPGPDPWTLPTALTYDSANGLFFLAEFYTRESPRLYSIAVNGSAAETFIGNFPGYTPIEGLAFLYDKAYPPPLVTLDGSDSWDPDGDSLTFAWSLVSIPAGSAAALSGLTGETTTFTPDLLGAYQIQLVVNDGEYDSGPATVTVNYLNLPPVADAGEDQTIPVDVHVDAVQLNGGGSYDPEGGPLTYAWTLLSAPTGSLADDGNISDVTAAAPRFWPDVSSVDEPFVLQLTVTDAETSSATDTVEILYQGIID